MEKYGTARHAKNYNMARAYCMLITTKGQEGTHDDRQEGGGEIETMQL